MKVSHQDPEAVAAADRPVHRIAWCRHQAALHRTGGGAEVARVADEVARLLDVP